MVKVLKGLYYQRGDRLSAGKGGRASWAWAIIFKGKDVLTREALWAIGDGATIRDATDPWIYTKAGFKVEPTTGWELNQEMKVGSLFDRSNKKWNEALIQELATPADVDQILRIPLPT